jgi:outer membrane protein OmpA-like peptidoglycan-associated protein
MPALKTIIKGGYMKAKVVTFLLLVVALGFFLGGCCKRAVKEEAPPPIPKVEEKVVALESVYFNFDKATLTQEAKTILERNIQVLKENPNVKVSVQGNTSAIATEQYNQMLSEKRATAVEGFLIKGGIAADRLSKVGYGKTKLQMPEPNPNKTESAAAKANRRVDFQIIAQ